MTSFDEFLDKKRRERKRGKLAGMDGVIQELKVRGASFREISEYLHLAHGISVTPRGLAKHVQRQMATSSAMTPLAPPQTSTGATTGLHPALPAPPQGNASPPSLSFEEDRQIEGTRIQHRSESHTDDVVTRYRLGSPEHQEMMARYRQRKKQSQT